MVQSIRTLSTNRLRTSFFLFFVFCFFCYEYFFLIQIFDIVHKQIEGTFFYVTNAFLIQISHMSKINVDKHFIQKQHLGSLISDLFDYFFSDIFFFCKKRLLNTNFPHGKKLSVLFKNNI